MTTATVIGVKDTARATTNMTDPSMMRTMTDFTPKMMKRTPRLIATPRKTNATPPPAQTMEDLNAADRVRLAKVLSINPSKLRDLEAPL